jgi:hypothetical protein
MIEPPSNTTLAAQGSEPPNPNLKLSIQGPTFFAQDPMIPPINSYGTFPSHSRPPSSILGRGSSRSSTCGRNEVYRPLLPSTRPFSQRVNHASADLLPFADAWRALGWFLKGGAWQRTTEPDVEGSGILDGGVCLVVCYSLDVTTTVTILFRMAVVCNANSQPSKIKPNICAIHVFPAARLTFR